MFYTLYANISNSNEKIEKVLRVGKSSSLELCQKCRFLLPLLPAHLPVGFSGPTPFRLGSAMELPIADNLRLSMIYVASSWRNPYYSEVVRRLKAEGHDVYDFRNPPHGGSGFHWTDVDENAPNWTFEEYAEGLHHPLAERQFEADLMALQRADTCVLVLPADAVLILRRLDGRCRETCYCVHSGDGGARTDVQTV